MQSASSIWSNL